MSIHQQIRTWRLFVNYQQKAYMSSPRAGTTRPACSTRYSEWSYGCNCGVGCDPNRTYYRLVCAKCGRCIAMNKATIAIDVGGTKISALLIQDGVVLERRKVESVIHTNLSGLAEHLYQLCHGWVERAEHLAIACTGQVRSNSIGFLSAKQELPLQQQLSELFHLPLTIINDAAAAAYAQFEVLKREGLFCNKTETLVYITVSTGVGGGSCKMVSWYCPMTVFVHTLAM